MPMLMTPHYWQLFAAYIQRPDLLLLPLLINRIQEWCNHWCVVLNPNKTKVLVVSRSMTLNPRHGDLVQSGVSICVSFNLDVRGVKFDSRLSAHLRRICARDCLWCLSKNRYFEVGDVCLCGHLYVASLLYYAIIFPIVEYCSPV